MQFKFFGKPKATEAPSAKTIPTPITPELTRHIAANPDCACLEDIIALIEYIDNAEDDWTDSADAMRIRSYCCQIAEARELRLVGNIQQAILHEACAEMIYSNMPADQRW